MNGEKDDEYWPMLDDGGGDDGKGLPPWLVFPRVGRGCLDAGAGIGDVK